MSEAMFEINYEHDLERIQCQAEVDFLTTDGSQPFFKSRQGLAIVRIQCRACQFKTRQVAGGTGPINEILTAAKNSAKVDLEQRCLVIQECLRREPILALQPLLPEKLR